MTISSALKYEILDLRLRIGGGQSGYGVRGRVPTPLACPHWRITGKVEADMPKQELQTRKSSGGVPHRDGIRVVMRKNRSRKHLMMNAIQVNPSQSHYSDFLSVKSARLIKWQAQAAITPEANK